MSQIYHSLTELVGNTPLFEVTNVEQALGLKARVLVKLEYFNPGGSVKDRVALAMIEDAERTGKLAKGGVIIEPTSGNTGIGLAWVASVKGYRSLWGAPCKAVSAFAPPVNTQDFNLNTKVVEPAYKDYEEGMAAAKAAGKPVLIDFTGYGCVNCRKMEASVWTDPSVTDILTKDYVLISLYVDDKTPLPQPMEVTFNGEKRTLRTIGDKWSYLQASKFGANAQPFYIPVDNEGNPLNAAFSFKEDVNAYLDFLHKGLDNYRK